MSCTLGRMSEMPDTPPVRVFLVDDHEVVVGVDYFEYDGRRYNSLSGIARAITGTNRNGWTFFGFASSRGMT